MAKPSDSDDWEQRKSQIIGLGERSFRKSYYPQLRENLDRLQRFRLLLDRASDIVVMLSVPEGVVVDANEALQIGLVNHVTTSESLLQRTKDILNVIMSKAPVAVSKIIECVNVAVVSDSAYTNGKSGYDKEIESFGDCFVTEDMKEGTTAFLEKRKPVFKGK